VYSEKEKRVYKVNLPEKFDVNAYRHINEDIADQSDSWLEWHYEVYGRKEGRRYQFDLPSDFVPADYRSMHSELGHLSDDEIKGYYTRYGKDALKLKKKGITFVYSLPT
jgi:hypothetical protein